MCKELEDELRCGEDAARKVADHLIAMGVAAVSIRVAIDGKIIQVDAAAIADINK